MTLTLTLKPGHGRGIWSCFLFVVYKKNVKGGGKQKGWKKISFCLLYLKLVEELGRSSRGRERNSRNCSSTGFF